MEKIRLNYENILSPNLAYRDYLRKLLPIYIEDYGVSNINLIKERINNAVYLFDSLPVDEINFIAEYGSEFQCRDKARLAYEECGDFFKKKRQIDEKMQKRFYNIIAEAYGVSGRYIDELFTIEIDSYGLNSQLALVSSNTSDDIKDDLKRKQEEYRRDCERLGVKCITDHRVIDRLFEERDAIDYETNLLLAKNLKWVRRLKKKIYVDSGAILTDEQLADLLFYCKSASCSAIDVGRGNKLVICYFPLAKNIMQGEVDGAFFHEVRHVVEMSDNYSGLQVFSCDKYLAMNEIRTEKNALHDLTRLKDSALFSSDGFVNGNWNCYRDMFYYTEGFFDEHRINLNKLAVRNNIKKFERFYGKKNLRKFELYLRRVHDAFVDDSWMYKKLYDEEKQKELVLRLNERYQSRH